MYNVITGELYAEMGKIMETREPYMTERLDGEDVISDEAMNHTRQLIAKWRDNGYEDHEIWGLLVERPDVVNYSIAPSDLIAIIGKMEKLLAFYADYALPNIDASRCKFELRIATPCDSDTVTHDPHTILDVGDENDYHTAINLAGALE